MGVDGLPLGSLMLCFDEARMPTAWEYQLADFGTQVASIVFERDRSHLTLRASEAKYRTLFESIDEGFCICEMLFDSNGKPIDYRFVEVNPVFGRLTGLQQATGKTARELVPDLEDYWFEIYGRVVLTGEPIRFEAHSPAMNNRWFDVNAFGVDEPQSHKFAILFTNISDRKQTEARLRENEARLLIALETAKLGSWQLDLVTGVLDSSDQCKANFGLPPEAELSYQRLLELIHPDDRQHVQQTVAQAIANQIDYDAEYPTIWLDGSIHWMIARGRTIYGSNGQPLRMIGVTLDITERKQVEEALRQSEQQLRLASEGPNLGLWHWDVQTDTLTWTDRCKANTFRLRIKQY